MCLAAMYPARMRPQPRPAFGGPFEPNREHRLRRLAGDSHDGAVREVQPWVSGRRELELAARLGKRDCEALPFGGLGSKRGVRVAQLSLSRS
jgi:hypothetical protein